MINSNTLKYIKPDLYPYTSLYIPIYPYISRVPTPCIAHASALGPLVKGAAWVSGSYMMIAHDDHTWWSYMMIMYDDHIWCSYVVLMCDDHIWWSSYLRIVSIYKHMRPHGRWSPAYTNICTLMGEGYHQHILPCAPSWERTPRMYKHVRPHGRAS